MIEDLAQIGPYRVERFVAEGGMAWVFEIADPRFSSRRLALKLLKPAFSTGDDVARFEDEARVLAEIDHPNFVTIFDSGRDEATGSVFYTMTFVDGPTLHERIAQRPPLTLLELGRVFLGLLDGLAELHQRDIVHRDVKPANILIDPAGRPRLADLGIVRLPAVERTLTGTTMGTISYMSPEQAMGRGVDPRSDVFSAGLSLYHAVAGQQVYDSREDFDSRSSGEILCYLGHLVYAGTEIDIVYPEGVDIPDGLRRVIARACRIDPDDRYQDVGAMASAISCALGVGVGVARSMPAAPSNHRSLRARPAASLERPFAGGAGAATSATVRSLALEKKIATTILRIVEACRPDHDLRVPSARGAAS
jgi:serine/threonine protein kinase